MSDNLRRRTWSEANSDNESESEVEAQGTQEVIGSYHERHTIIGLDSDSESDDSNASLWVVDDTNYFRPNIEDMTVFLTVLQMNRLSFKQMYNYKTAIQMEIVRRSRILVDEYEWNLRTYANVFRELPEVDDVGDWPPLSRAEYIDRMNLFAGEGVEEEHARIMRELHIWISNILTGLRTRHRSLDELMGGVNEEFIRLLLKEMSKLPRHVNPEGNTVVEDYEALRFHGNAWWRNDVDSDGDLYSEYENQTLSSGSDDPELDSPFD